MSGSWSLIFLIVLLTCGLAEGRKGYGGDGDQEWGHVTVRENAKMFWWLHYVNPPSGAAKHSVYDRPLLIWLQGGPGASSTGFGNFEELGPVDLNGNTRNHTWINDYNVLFIDNPVGTGFSHAEKISAFATTNRQIAEDLLECMRGFYKQLPKFVNVSTYITAESYGGKMAAEFALVWFKAQKNMTIKSDFKGVGLVDPWISPIDSMKSWAPFLLHTGMIDKRGHDEIEKLVEETKLAIDQHRWGEATSLWSRTEDVIFKTTNNIDFYNILAKKNPIKYSQLAKRTTRGRILPRHPTPGDLSDDEIDDLLDVLMNGKVKEALNLNVTWGEYSSHVFQHLREDFMRPATDIVERLLNETDVDVLVFTGQLDLIVATPGTVAWVERLKWSGHAAWQKSERKPLVVDNVIEGYVQEYSKFKMYWINRSGHMVPKDNPPAMKLLLQHLTGK